jgi:PAS domain S-box-containing protein
MSREAAPSLPSSVLIEILEGAPDALIVVDEHGTIVLANAQAETLFQYSREDLIGQGMEILIPRSTRGSHAELRNSYAKLPEVRPMGSGLDLHGCRSDGSEIPVEISLSPLHLDGRKLVAAAIRDNSESRRIREDLKAATEAARLANEAKGKFLAAACHDLRQPLQAALLFATTLDDEIEEGPATKLVGKLRSSLRATGQLLDRLLDVSRLESGTIQPQIIDVDMSLLFDRLRETFEPIAADAGLQLSVVSSRLKVRSDAELLGQILQNLISNATRYTDEGRVLVGCRRSGQELRIQVWDTGRGIDASQKERIFEEFYRAGAPTAGAIRGLGLGLSIVRQLADLLGHRVELNSTPGRGTCFEVMVPLSERQRPRS